MAGEGVLDRDWIRHLFILFQSCGLLPDTLTTS